MSMHHVQVWSPQRPEGGIRVLELGLQTVVNCHMSAGNKSGPLEEQLLLLTTEPSPVSTVHVLKHNGDKCPAWYTMLLSRAMVQY